MYTYSSVLTFENIRKDIRKNKSVLENWIVVDCNSKKKKILLDFRNNSLYRVLKFLHDLRKQQKQNLFKFTNSISQCF